MGVQIHDVRGSDKGSVFVDGVFDNFLDPKATAEPRTCELRQPDGTLKARILPEKMRKFSNEILYNRRGLQILDELANSAEYYVPRCERDLLKIHMQEIAQLIPDGASIVELGCGSMSRTATFLDHVRKAGKRGIKFFALDIEKDFLHASLLALQKDQQERCSDSAFEVEFAGIYGSYTDILPTFLKGVKGPRVLLWLGTSLGNLSRSDAAALLARFQKEGLEGGDLFFIGIDKPKDPTFVARAYDDSAGLQAEFGINGLDHLNEKTGMKSFDRTQFEYFAGYNENERRHESYYRSRIAQTVLVPVNENGANDVVKKVCLEENELIRYSFSHKYSMEDLEKLALGAGLVLETTWADLDNLYNFSLFRKPHTS